MANKKITELPTVTTVAGTEVVPVVQGGVTKQATVQQLLSLILAGADARYDTFLEVAQQFGLDEATVTALQALVAQKADAASVAATTVAFTDINGNPITGKRVQIRLTADLTDISDIVVVTP